MKQISNTQKRGWTLPVSINVFSLTFIIVLLAQMVLQPAPIVNAQAEIVHATDISGDQFTAKITVTGTGSEYINPGGGRDAIPVTWTPLGENKYEADVDIAKIPGFMVVHPDSDTRVIPTFASDSDFVLCAEGDSWVCIRGDRRDVTIDGGMYTLIATVKGTGAEQIHTNTGTFTPAWEPVGPDQPNTYTAQIQNAPYPFKVEFEGTKGGITPKFPLTSVFTTCGDPTDLWICMGGFGIYGEISGKVFKAGIEIQGRGQEYLNLGTNEQGEPLRYTPAWVQVDPEDPNQFTVSDLDVSKMFPFKVEYPGVVGELSFWFAPDSDFIRCDKGDSWVCVKATAFEAKVSGKYQATTLNLTGSGREYLNTGTGTQPIIWTEADGRFSATLDLTELTSFKIEYPGVKGSVIPTIDPASEWELCPGLNDGWVCRKAVPLPVFSVSISGTVRETTITVVGTGREYLNDGKEKVHLIWKDLGNNTYSVTMDMIAYRSFKIEVPDAGKTIEPTIDPKSEFVASPSGDGWVTWSKDAKPFMVYIATVCNGCVSVFPPITTITYDPKP